MVKNIFKLWGEVIWDTRFSIESSLWFVQRRKYGRTLCLLQPFPLMSRQLRIGNKVGSKGDLFLLLRIRGRWWGCEYDIVLLCALLCSNLLYEEDFFFRMQVAITWLWFWHFTVCLTSCITYPIKTFLKLPLGRVRIPLEFLWRSPWWVHNRRHSQVYHTVMIIGLFLYPLLVFEHMALQTLWRDNQVIIQRIKSMFLFELSFSLN